jgi:CRP/FNR family cyclic AMP-dependent transcriptional regulator
MAWTDEDALTYLPHKPIERFAKGETIYATSAAIPRLFMVVAGRVKVTHATSDGGSIVGRIVAPEGLFGEYCLLGAAPAGEEAVALDMVETMSWQRSEIEQQIEREPRLGMALSQDLVRHARELEDRIVCMALNKTAERVMMAFVQLANSLGKPQPDGLVRMGALTHHTLADYVGTSREIVTSQMNRLRGLGLIHYSRQFIDVDTQGLERLRQARPGVNRKRSAAAF